MVTTRGRRTASASSAAGTAVLRVVGQPFRRSTSLLASLQPGAAFFRDEHAAGISRGARANGGAHRLIAWDRDTTFQEIDAQIFARVEENALFRRVLMFPDLRALYLDVLVQCAAVAAQDRWLEAELMRMHQLIRDAVAEEPDRLYSTAEYEDAMNHLRSFARSPHHIAIGAGD